MTDREAMTMALRILENKRLRTDEQLIPIVVDALRQALAQPEQEPVSIGIDVTPEGTHVVACYNKPNSVREMFYSEFHPMNKTDKPKSMSWEEWESIVYEKMKRQYQWQGLTDDEKNNCLVEADPCEALATPEAQELMREVEAKLKEKNNAV